MLRKMAIPALTLLMALPSILTAQPIRSAPVDKWVTVTANAAGTDATAQEQATKLALRKAVEESCGTFIKAESKAQNYQAIYDKIFADTVGYVKEYQVVKAMVMGGETAVTVRARVSTQKFQSDWASIAATMHLENNPRVIIAVSEVVHTHATTAPVVRKEEGGIVQSTIEDFFLNRGVTLMDRQTAGQVNKRDILLASMKDDTAEVAALGARFKAEVVIIGQATAQYGKQLDVGGQTMYQYVASLNVRAIRTDSAQVIMSRTYGPVTATTLQYGGGDAKALAKLAEESAPGILAAVVEAWRRQVHVSRDINLSVSGMAFDGFDALEQDLKKVRGVQTVNLREITEGVANIDVKYDFDTKAFAQAVRKLETVKLEVTEFNSNRVKAKVIK